MRHIKYIGTAIIYILCIMVAVGHGGYIMLKPLVTKSDFRLSLASDASRVMRNKSNVLLLVGNSRIMGGVDATLFKGNRRYDAAYNLAYNGLDFTDTQVLIDAFQQSCECNLSKVVINAGALPQKRDRDVVKIKAISDVKIFLATFSKSLSQNIVEMDPILGGSLYIFPLMHFNNELFLRSAYYLVTGKSDQKYSNDYSFQLNDEMVQRLKSRDMRVAIDATEIATLKAKLSQKNIGLTVIIPPFHPSYVENVQHIDSYIDGIKRAAGKSGISVHDHSRLFINHGNLFADPVHINKAGQKRYTHYLVNNL